MMARTLPCFEFQAVPWSGYEELHFYDQTRQLSVISEKFSELAPCTASHRRDNINIAIMAETAEDTIKAVDVPDVEVNDATNEEITTLPEKAVDSEPAVKDEPTKSDDVKETVKDEAPSSDIKPDSSDDKKDLESTTNATNGDSKADSQDGADSPTRKRKSPPVSVSAHDRYNKSKRGRGGQGYGNNSRVKTKFEDQPESSDPEEIRRQVEFYFSDSNLPIDAYLLSETGGSQNRPVPLKVIHNFKRMRHFQPYAKVREALEGSEFLVLNEKDELTRKKALDGKFGDDPQHNRTLLHSNSMARSIYAKGFGREGETTALDIEAFFAPYGPLNAVRLRRHEDGEFKGSVFVEFDSEDGARQFLDLDPKPTWTVTTKKEDKKDGEANADADGKDGEDGKDAEAKEETVEKELEIMSKQEYVDMKHEGIMEGTVKPRSQSDRPQYHRGGRGRGGGGGNRDNRDRDGGGGGSREWVDKDDWKGRKERDSRDDRGRGGDRGGRGRGRGGRGRGDRGGRGNSRGRGGGGRRSPDFRDRREDERDGEKRSRRGEEGDRAAAEGDSGAKSNGDAGESRKRAREDDGAGGEAKRAKDDSTA
ncbi:hypothetical protein LTR56_018529 [Elasticomyces elasticus]|nr:hypothetical protein LTR56_018529 [Elasticomyces elasticus]KAK3636465.1 hypothetical protein LTR22_018698 [Elasticomyces elasticus]KAK4920191.1 hypothetical protein LTR49_012290 [Elasticomyces elasticus]KAK5751706.1 hypothetical protein LTS12_018235 [Elasticomyces elasticus]